MAATSTDPARGVESEFPRKREILAKFVRNCTMVGGNTLAVIPGNFLPNASVRRALIRVLPVVAFLIPTLLVADYTLNHFYVSGAYYWDSGYVSYLTTHRSGWPLDDLPTMGRTYFSYHISPIFYLTSPVYSLVSPWVPRAVFFSVFYGAQFGLIALAITIMFRDTFHNRTAILVCLISILAALNGPALAAIGFPHYEVLIPALLLLSLALLFSKQQVLAFLALALGLACREDAGLHYFGIFLLLYLHSALPIKWLGRGDSRSLYLKIAVCCFVYSTIAISIQKTYYQQDIDSLKVYIGSPPFSHITPEFFVHRYRFYTLYLWHILVPFGVTAIIALIRRDLFLALGYLSVVPWIAWSFLADSWQAGNLRSYYGFPIILAIAWPAVAYAARDRKSPARSPLSYLLDLGVVVLVSILSFVYSAKGNHDDTPWKGLGFQWFGRITSTEHGLNDLLSRRAMLGRLVVGDAVAALAPEQFGRENWKFDFRWGDEVTKIDTIMFQPGARNQEQISTAIVRGSFGWFCHLQGTNFLIATRTRVEIPRCVPVQTGHQVAPAKAQSD